MSFRIEEEKNNSAHWFPKNKVTDKRAPTLRQQFEASQQTLGPSCFVGALDKDVNVILAEFKCKCSSLILKGKYTDKSIFDNSY